MPEFPVCAKTLALANSRYSGIQIIRPSPIPIPALSSPRYLRAFSKQMSSTILPTSAWSFGSSPRSISAPEQVAEHAAEVLVPRVGHERARVGQHADEVREQADVRQRVDLPLDAFLLIEKPPAAAELHPAGERSVLEVADHRRQRVVVHRVVVVEDGLRQRALLLELIEIPRRAPRPADSRRSNRSRCRGRASRACGC